MSAAGEADELVLQVRVQIRGKSPRELRDAFAAAIREEIFDAAASGRIELVIAEELYRTVPQEGD